MKTKKIKGILIDVNPPEHYEEAHIDGAENACVYEVVFLDSVKKLAKKTAEITVYGPTSSEGMYAVQKLKNAGYKKVFYLDGGMENTKEKIIKGKKVVAQKIPSKTYTLSSGIMHWVGRAIGNKHIGTIDVKKGSLTIKNGRIVSGSFEVDMKTIKNLDLKNKKLNNMLVGHLKSAFCHSGLDLQNGSFLRTSFIFLKSTSFNGCVGKS